MARYIDADKLIETNRVLLEHAQMNGMYNHARIYERFVNSIEETPTADVAPKTEVARDILSDLKKAVHDKAVYPHNEEFAFINLRVFDTVIQSYLKKYAESDP